MGLIEPLAIASTLPSGVLPLGASLLIWVPLVGLLGIAAIGLIWSVVPRRQRSLRTLRLVHSTVA